MFLMADVVVAARRGQKTPEGYYNMERMLKRDLGRCRELLKPLRIWARTRVQRHTRESL